MITTPRLHLPKSILTYLLPLLQLIDLTIKKKKKKKKTFDLDAALGEGHDDDELMDTCTTPDKENMEPFANTEDFDGTLVLKLYE